MDIVLIHTFLEVAATRSFVSASERLFVTQSAVSLRIQRLEASLGKPLFRRSKAGAELTPAGHEFESYALSLIKIWQEARQQVGIPEGYTKSLTVGGQYSLWPRLGFQWIDRMQAAMPGLSIRAELGMPDRLTRFLVEGVIQVAVIYTPQIRPGLSAEKVFDEDLVLVASWPTSLDDLRQHYVFVDWGPEFLHAHALALPTLTKSGLTLSLGALAVDYVLNRRAAAYVPAEVIKRYLDDGRLHLVPDAPVFPFPVWSVWRDDLDADLREIAASSLVAVRTQIATDQKSVLASLSTRTEGALGKKPSESSGSK